ncbi:MAG: Transglycosylase domain [Acidimicrobiales bacterium]|nr:Transglycosylase domain [Acidimicrobiales bacterium]
MSTSPDTTAAIEEPTTSMPDVGRRKVMRRAAAVSLVALGVALATSGCSPEDQARMSIQKHFGSKASIAIQIAECESRLQAGAISPGGTYVGLFQISKAHAGWIKRDLGYSWSQMTDGEVNATVARELYNRAGGFSPWHGACGGRLGI